MEFKLHSDNLSVTIQSKGAEISSILFHDLEYIWQAKPDVWPRHTPVLFPIVGKLKDNTFEYNQKLYSLSQHGFARDKEFKMIKQSKTEIEFELVSDSETKKIFPFQFKLMINYKIKNNEVFCNYNVSNISNSHELLFSIGAHPGFKVPLLETEKLSDYSLKFNSNKKYFTTQLSNGLLTDEKKELELVNGKLQLTKNLFDNDALVFEDSQIDSVLLKSKTSGKGIELICKNWPYFGIWSKPGCEEFICLEPWYGIADSVNGTYEFKNKKGIIQLKSEEEFDCGFSVRFL